jgi:hypothetical protein
VMIVKPYTTYIHRIYGVLNTIDLNTTSSWPLVFSSTLIPPSIITYVTPLTLPPGV